ncbi:unnamed protein product [Moneuplotes crassus]|uniref:Uncharacterized protein n=1 Tax=Euplotes crassus TaxID=5936 RepID=A0AAD1UQR7_EUPCR|nr:unnamed protein product [Moneuplotes crassus]
MESMSRATQEENTQIISLEKSILEETKEQNISTCQSICYNIFPGEKDIKPLDSDSEKIPNNSYLAIHLNYSEFMQLEQSFKYLKFFDINHIRFVGFDSKNKVFADLLESLFPNKTNELCFYPQNVMNLNRSNYLNSLLRLSSKVVQQVIFGNFGIGLPQLKRLVAAYKHVRELILMDCKLSIPSVPDLSKALINCQIQKLYLGGCGSSNFSDWENNLNQFKNLVQGLASSPNLKSSLKEVNIFDCRVNQDKAEQIFDENQFGHVKIIEK